LTGELPNLGADYLAGYIDGEGCFSIHSGSIRVTVNNCYPVVLQTLQRRYGGSFRLSVKATDRHRTAFSFEIYGTKAERLIIDLLPHLVEKQSQAQLLLDYRQTAAGDARDAIELEIKRLKRIDYYSI
jgi:hypothetical protein